MQPTSRMNAAREIPCPWSLDKLKSQIEKSSKGDHKMVAFFCFTRLAQLVRALLLQSRGREFEPHTGYQFYRGLWDCMGWSSHLQCETQIGSIPIRSTKFVISVSNAQV